MIIPDTILCDHMHEMMVSTIVSGPKYHFVHLPVTKLLILPAIITLQCKILLGDA